MDDVLKALVKEIEKTSPEINVDDVGLKHTINNLCYSAEQTGVIDFALDEEDAIIVYKLVQMAIKYKGNLPEKFRL